MNYEQIKEKCEIAKIKAKEIIDNYDLSFRYSFLSRLQSDCKYYLGNGNRYEGVLYYHDKIIHLQVMCDLYFSFKKEDRPEWLTTKELSSYLLEM